MNSCVFVCVLLVGGYAVTGAGALHLGGGEAAGGAGASATVGGAEGADSDGEAPYLGSPCGETGRDLSEVPELEPNKEVVCRKKSWGVDCMIACAEEGLSCPAGMKHPYSPSSGTGKLWKCSGAANAEVCKYVYDNGDECTWDRKKKLKACKYSN
jgi:hypothetical protein